VNTITWRCRGLPRIRTVDLARLKGVRLPDLAKRAPVSAGAKLEEKEWAGTEKGAMSAPLYQWSPAQVSLR
jgi:hypothetical protein